MSIDFVIDQRLQSELSVSAKQSYMVETSRLILLEVR